ncbi:MAG: hypothetical protein JWQ08_1069, partial [Deinococcus sp.]|nr:hypothetical protein [Deinococcus sp.]
MDIFFMVVSDRRLTLTATFSELKHRIPVQDDKSPDRCPRLAQYPQWVGLTLVP